MDALNNDYPMTATCCNHNSATNDYERKTLVAGHAYTITGADTVATSSGDVKLIQVRNPHGDKTWTGDWSGEDTVNWDDNAKA